MVYKRKSLVWRLHFDYWYWLRTTWSSQTEMIFTWCLLALRLPTLATRSRRLTVLKANYKM